MTSAALRRLAEMPPEELRFRVVCEVRKAAGRLRSKVTRPRWDRRRLLRALGQPAGSNAWTAATAALRRGDDRAAHAAFADHFRTRTSPFPVSAHGLRSLADRIRTDFPGAPAHAAARADAILNGEYDLLGYTRVAIGQHPRWHLDALHDRQPPRIFWADVPYLDPACGDHKIIWELNRHQHWLALGRAHALCGDARYYAAFTRQLASWLADNPPLVGVNWASMLELGFRAISWLWALELFAPAASAADDEPWLVDLLLGIDRQLTHIEHNLSYYFSPNTHLTGEALALYVAGTSLPELRASARRAALGRDVLLREATRQVRPDGGHAELSAHYHRYSTDFYLLATVVARRAQDPSAPAFEQAALAQARFLRVIADDTGRRPQIGDDDGGQLFGMCGRAADDCGDTLATAAVLLHDPSLAIGGTPEETHWLCGPPAAAEATSTMWPSTALTSSGYFVSRTPRGDHLVFDAGPHGFLNGGHAHSDALACTLVIAGRPLLIDPGTATYTMDPAVRDRFRNSLMHNTVALDGRPQSETDGPFHWKTTVNARAPIWQSSSGCDYVEGTHDAYAPRRHTRAILAIHGVGWWIVDHVLGSGTTAIGTSWHLAPAWRCSIGTPHVCRLDDGDRTLALASSSPLSLLAPGADPAAVRSPAYGVVEPAPVVRAATVESLPATVATFIPASREYAADLRLESVAVTSAPGSGWHGRAFALRWNGSAMTLLTAVELSGIAARETSAPLDQWGTAELRTDARLALVIDRASAPSEAIVVNGATVTATRADRLVALARRVPLLRLTLAPVAPRMHEVGAGIQP